MARRPRLFAPGLLYHVIVRGNQRRKTFYDERDYRAYLERLARYRQRYDYIIHAYCLMPNHAHLLVESGRSPLGKFMQGLQQSYSQYFNLRHRKVGHVFQGRYQAIVCQKDAYLLELLRYIHLNPVRAGLSKDPKAYPYTGHQAYLQGKSSDIIDPRKILTMLGGPAGYRSFIRDGMKEGHQEQYYDLQDQRFLGTEGFGEKLQETEEPPKPRRRKPIQAMIKSLAQKLAVSEAQLCSADRSWKLSQSRTKIAYVLVRRQGYGLKEVANYLKRDPSTMSVLIGRLAERMVQDSGVQHGLEQLVKLVSK